MEEVDIWRSAQQLLKAYGDDAVAMAEKRAEQLKLEGTVDGAHAMMRVAAAIRELRRAAPKSGETIN